MDEYEQGNRSAMARKVKSSAQAIHDLCNGKSVPGGDMLAATLRAYPRVSPEWLVLGRPPRERTDPDRAGLAIEEAVEILLKAKQPPEADE